MYKRKIRIEKKENNDAKVLKRKNTKEKLLLKVLKIQIVDVIIYCFFIIKMSIL